MTLKTTSCITKVDRGSIPVQSCAQPLNNLLKGKNYDRDKEQWMSPTEHSFVLSNT